MSEHFKQVSAEIVTVGTELLLGHLIDTNSAYLGQKLAEIGINVYFKSSVGDNDERLLNVLRQAASRADVIIITGGLGPTVDDITKNAVVKLLDRKLILNEKVLDKIRGFFAARKVRMAQNNVSQALVPSGAVVIENNNGTAPGLRLQDDNGKYYILMPGVPREMKRMTEESVLPFLKETFRLQETIKSRTLKCFGLGESTVDEKINDIFVNSTNPTIALLASHTEVKIRLTSKAKSEAAAEESIKIVEKEILRRLGDNIFAADDGSMESAVAALLTEKKLTLSVAESCTGGLITDKLTDIPGASAFLKLGIVCYSNASKEEQLKVPATALTMFGAVSRQVAGEMAMGAKKLALTDLALAVTGIAGPGGATEDKPVGLVYIALSTPTGLQTQEFRFSGDRVKIKEQSAQTALDMLRRYLINPK